MTFIEYHDPTEHLLTLLNLDTVLAIIRDKEGKAVFVINDKDKTRLPTEEPFEIIRDRVIGAST